MAVQELGKFFVLVQLQVEAQGNAGSNPAISSNGKDTEGGVGSNPTTEISDSLMVRTPGL